MEDADVIYHLAAVVGVRNVLENPVATLETNVGGTENVLRLSAQSGNKKVIIASTSEVYGKGTKIPFREDDDVVYGPSSVSRWGYAYSKAVDEFLALGYHQEKGLPVVIVRFFNIVGPRQVGRYGMVMPRFISQALAGEPITVYGDGEQRRAFTYVKDVSRAVADIAQTPSAEGQVFNLGTSNDVSINHLAEVVRDTVGSESPIVRLPYSEVYGTDFEDSRSRSADITKIQRHIHYEPTIDLSFIVKEIAASIRPAGTPDVSPKR